jgi:hypothetical protein
MEHETHSDFLLAQANDLRRPCQGQAGLSFLKPALIWRAAAEWSLRESNPSLGFFRPACHTTYTKAPWCPELSREAERDWCWLQKPKNQNYDQNNEKNAADSVHSCLRLVSISAVSQKD